MWLVLTVTLPLFFVILAGYLTARRGLIDAAGIKGITGFVFYFALPLMLFYLMATSPLAERFDPRFFLAYLGLALAFHGLGMAVTRWGFDCRLNEQAVGGFSCCFGNNVFIGLPIALSLFGPEAALPMALLIVIEGGFVMPYTVALLEIARAPAGRQWRAVLPAGAAVLRNPIIVAAFLGAGAALVELPLPALFVGLVELVRGAAVPCALFALGASLAGFPLSEKVAETAVLVTVKLLAFPVVVFLILGLIPGLDPDWRKMGVLAAAMPIGANVYLLANRYESYVARASTATLISTAISVVTVTLLAGLLAQT